MGSAAEDIQARIDTASNWIIHLTDYQSAAEHARSALAAFEAAELAPDERARLARSLAYLFEQVNDPATAERLLREAAEPSR